MGINLSKSFCFFLCIKQTCFIGKDVIVGKLSLSYLDKYFGQFALAVRRNKNNQEESENFPPD